ncbi:amidohydrolase [Sinanaerobacter chloroacetimidivorans]|uniref:Amidohydrolase n=1 Tax=Sinanaerobacter chloroacetimidivorans TaxID=2818044 RepID=A0A8J7W0L5_9FIRM|nr:amidohydrolase [Sinanaerobacter chloroacetimidivorans]MBR0598174.1 amidohydrolase [Sinanaerobacter chloroacetimidivorans]
MRVKGEVSMKADIILYNGSVLTVDHKDSVVSAVATKDNKIIYAGSDDEALKFFGENTKLIDLKGRSLVPGFIDSHLHTAVLGANSLAIDCRSPGVTSIEDIKRLIKEAAKVTPKGQWIRGWGYDHSKLTEKRHPNRYDLDEAAPEHPVILTRVCAHISAHNSLSLKTAGIADDASDPEGGVMDREHGRINGVMRENAHMQILKTSQLSREELIHAMSAANDILIREGITSVHDSGGYGAVQMSAIQDAVKEKKLRLRLYAMIFSFVENLSFVEEYIHMGLHTGFGDDHFRLGPVKVMIDGSSSGPTAATIEPYCSNPGDSGILSMTQEQVDDIIIRAHKAGWQVTSHAVGDKAVTMIVSAIEKALQQFPRENHRHRIEHCAMINDELLDRIKKTGIIPIPNPIFLYEFGDGYMVNYGKERAYRMFPNKSYFDRGILAAGSSDSPITFSNPILNMHLAVNRETQTGQMINLKERISVKEALRMFTYHGAYASFEEDRKGSIEAGKLADLVLLSDDLLKVSSDRIKEITVDMTIIDGDIVYRKESE